MSDSDRSTVQFRLKPDLSRLTTAEDAYKLARWHRRDFGVMNEGEITPEQCGVISGIVDAIKYTALAGIMWLDIKQPEPVVYRALKGLGYRLQLSRDANGQDWVRVHWLEFRPDEYDQWAKQAAQNGFDMSGGGEPRRIQL